MGASVTTARIVRVVLAMVSLLRPDMTVVAIPAMTVASILLPVILVVVASIEAVVSIATHFSTGVTQDPVAASIEAAIDAVARPIEFVRECEFTRSGCDKGEEVELAVDHVAASIELSIVATGVANFGPAIVSSIDVSVGAVILSFDVALMITSIVTVTSVISFAGTGRAGHRDHRDQPTP